MTPAIINFLTTYCIKVVISIDGNTTIHDKHRHAMDGQGTHYVVRHSLLTLLRNNISCVASITVHPDSSSVLLDNVRYLHELGVEQIDIGPAYGTVTWKSIDNLNLVKSLMDVAGYMREVNSKSNRLDIGPLYQESEHVGGILSERWGCHAASTNLAFLPNGKIAGCSALAMLASRFPDLILGDVFDGLDQQAVNRLLHIAQATAEERSSCRKCKTASDCTGGCLAINYSTTGFALEPPQFYCDTISIISPAWHKAWASAMHYVESKM